MIAASLERVGASAIGIAREAGGITLLLLRVLRALVPPRLDGRELLRNLYKMGNESLPIVSLTAFFVGGIMVIQSGMIVRRFSATGLVGWAVGFGTFRELGPILISLMFSGRVGSNNTAELGTMTVTEQIDGLRALAIDPVGYLLVPRVVAMVITLFVLTVIGELVAVAGAMLFAKVMLGIELGTFYHTLIDNVKAWDYLHGLIKTVFFGLAIALTSCHFGVTVKGGAVGVGRAVNSAVVAAALSILILDFFLTNLLG